MAHGFEGEKYGRNQRHWLWKDPCLFAARHDSHQRTGKLSSSKHVLVRGRVILFSCFLTIPSSLIFIRVQQYLKPGEGPIVLVLAPTRELAVQIKEECDKFGSSSDIKNTVVYGGVPKSRQIRDLRSGVESVIATPGRLIDHLEQGNTNLKRVTYLVLDEAGKKICFLFVFIGDKLIVYIFLTIISTLQPFFLAPSSFIRSYVGYGI